MVQEDAATVERLRKSVVRVTRANIRASPRIFFRHFNSELMKPRLPVYRPNLCLFVSPAAEQELRHFLRIRHFFDLGNQCSSQETIGAKAQDVRFNCGCRLLDVHGDWRYGRSVMVLLADFPPATAIFHAITNTRNLFR